MGNGKPSDVQKRAAEEMIRTAQKAKMLGVKTVTGFTGSSIWNCAYAFPPTSQEMIEKGFRILPKSGSPY